MLTMLKRRLILALVLTLAFGALVSFGTTAASGSKPDPVNACVAKYTAKDRSLRRGQVGKAVGAVRAVGGKGLAVKLRRDADGSGSEVEVAAGDDSNPDAMAREYEAAGRSVLDDARAAGVSAGLVRKLCAKALRNGDLRLMATSGTGKIVDSICVHDSVDYVEWDGCVTRYRATNDGDPNWNYGIDDAQAWGHETNWEFWEDLHKGGVRNNYDTSRVDILKASPSSDLSDVPRCYNLTFGASAGGFGATTGGTVCPARWNITRTGITNVPEYHKVQWEGETNDDREAVAVTAFRYRPGYTTAYHLITNYDVH